MIDDDALGHRVFSELPELLARGDLLVLNETRVIAARIFGRRMPTGGRVELLLLHPCGATRYRSDATRWVCLVRPARRLGQGERISFGDLGGAVVAREMEHGAREIAFELNVGFEAFLASAGRLPLPPYIHNESDEAQRRYQTVFARVPGSVAAPTASLHFTTELLERLAQRGVEIARLTLDVGLGTFRPMASERIDDHAMHAEAYAISPACAAAIECAQRQGRRIVAAGTTVVRALEGNIQKHGRIVPGEDVTDLFITPGFAFNVVDAMITNFHLPKSSLLVLVSAFAGRERVLRAYRAAIEARYRFFSFGDATFIARRGSA